MEKLERLADYFVYFVALLDHIAMQNIKMQPIAVDVVCSVFVSMCLSAAHKHEPGKNG